MDYISAGLYEDALTVLKKALKYFPDFPLLYYYAGFASDKAGAKETARKFFYLGAIVTSDRVFPWQGEAVEILNMALRYYPDLPNTYEYLGDLMFYRYRYEEGLKYFYQAKKLGSKSSVVYRNIALGHLRVNMNHRMMAGSYVKAVDCDPDDWEIYFEGDRFLSVYGYLSRRKKIFKRVSKEVFDHPKAAERRIKLFNDLGRFDEAIKLLGSKNFYPWEGEFFIRELYESVYCNKAEALIKEGKYESALKFIEAGANRLGASSSVDIVTGQKSSGKGY